MVNKTDYADYLSDGILLVDKPVGMTSFGVVARVRRVLSSQAGKKVKVGHTGTLDPFASGLMILLIGNECKNAKQYSSLSKSYLAKITLGKVSSTGDPEGELSDVSAKMPSLDKIKEVAESFEGVITQKPPIYSAIKIAGERAYKLARAGKEFDMPTRQVEIYKLDVSEYAYTQLEIYANVSSGTYIRTLAEDIGAKLGVGAYCSELRRLSVGKWSVEEAKQLSELGIDS